jgi:hypothetical protein
MSINAFARRKGVNETTIRKGIASGRLEGSLGNKNGRMVIVDVELPDREWNDSRDPSKIRRPNNGGGWQRSIADDRGRLIRAQAARMELEVRRRRGELFDARLALKAWSTMTQAFRAQFLALPRTWCTKHRPAAPRPWKRGYQPPYRTPSGSCPNGNHPSRRARQREQQRARPHADHRRWTPADPGGAGATARDARGA